MIQDSATKMDRFALFVVRHRFAFMVGLLVFTVAFSAGAIKMRTDVILSDMFPRDHPYLKLVNRFGKVFGTGGSGVVIAIKAKQGDIFNGHILGKVKKITEEIELWDEVYRQLTVSIASYSTKVVKTKAQGEISMSPLMYPDIPESEEGMELLKKNIFSNPIHAGMLVSHDGTAALVLTEFKEEISYERAFELLRSVVNRFSDEEASIHIVGFPMLMGWIQSYKLQIFLVGGVSTIVMLIVLFLVFRNVVGMIAPVLSCLIETALGLGFIGWTGLNFSPLLYVLAFLVGARMVSNAVQVTHRYIEEFRSANGDKEVATYNTIRAMQMPNAAAVATDVIGFMVLGLANIPLMRDVAIMMSFWMLTILLEGTITPVIRSFLPVGHFEKASDRAKAEGGAGGNGLIPRTNVAIATFSIGRGRCAVGIGILLVFVCACYLATGFKVGDPTPGSPVLWPDHAYNVDQGLVNEEFNASSETFVLYFEGAPRSVYDPEVLYTFEKFDRHMRETLPDIYKSSMSLIDLLKMTNLTFHDGDQIHFQLPREPRLLEGIIGLVRNKAGTPALARYIDGGLERAQIILFFSDHVSENMLRIRHAAYGFFEQRGGWKTAEGEFRLAGGRIGMEIALNEETKRAHQKIDASVLVTIFVMCSLAFRSFVAGAMLTIPLLLSNMIAFAYMAMADIGLSVSTLPCSAIGVAVGVDFGIYLYSRCIEEYPRRRGIRDTVLTAVRTSGTGVVFTAMTVILPLFTWYFISGLKFQAQMGLFLAILILINLISALTLHPLMLTVINPRFVRRKAGAALS